MKEEFWRRPQVANVRVKRDYWKKKLAADPSSQKAIVKMKQFEKELEDLMYKELYVTAPAATAPPAPPPAAEPKRVVNFSVTFD